MPARTQLLHQLFSHQYFKIFITCCLWWHTHNFMNTSVKWNSLTDMQRHTPIHSWMQILIHTDVHCTRMHTNTHTHTHIHKNSTQKICKSLTYFKTSSLYLIHIKNSWKVSWCFAPSQSVWLPQCKVLLNSTFECLWIMCKMSKYSESVQLFMIVVCWLLNIPATC